MVNQTISKFGYPATLVRDYEHWMVLLRPAQVTAGSLVLAAKSDATAYGDLPAAAFVEQRRVVAEVEATLRAVVDYERINYLMLMMVDPNVHFHVIPRYDGSRSLGGIDIKDTSWPGPPDLRPALTLDDQGIDRMKEQLIAHWRSADTNAG